jgi:hypothetical protein
MATWCTTRAAQTNYRSNVLDKEKWKDKKVKKASKIPSINMKWMNMMKSTMKKMTIITPILELIQILKTPTCKETFNITRDSPLSRWWG